MLSIEDVKRADMVAFVESHYGMRMHKQGGQYVGLSPLKPESRPSFFVKQKTDGHWVFNDFASGNGGSLIDLVMALEGCGSVGQALGRLQEMLGEEIGCESGTSGVARRPVMKDRKYKVEAIYHKIRGNDWRVAGAYLQERGVEEGLVRRLGNQGLVLHNRHREKSYCCFAVRDRGGRLCCLDNHEIGGGSKFVLGKKAVFSLDWAQLPEAEEVFVCESVIDYLSIKTLEGDAQVGLALLGNVVAIPGGLLAAAKRIQAALDADAGGLKGLLDLREAYPDKELVLWDLGEHKDANEHLLARRQAEARTSLSAKDKLAIYKEFTKAPNKSEVARRWGINRSYMYEIVNDCEELLLAGMSGRQAGRKARNEPRDLTQAKQRMGKLEAAWKQEAKERERLYVRGEFLALHLKWAEEELAKLKTRPKEQKRQLKKTKKKRR